MQGSIPEELRPLIGNRIFGCDDCQLVARGTSSRSAATSPISRARNGLDAARSPICSRGREAEFLAAHRRLGDPPHRLRTLAAQYRGRAGQCAGDTGCGLVGAGISRAGRGRGRIPGRPVETRVWPFWALERPRIVAPHIRADQAACFMGSTKLVWVSRLWRSTYTSVGLWFAASASSHAPYAQMITRSPGCARCAAAPLTEIVSAAFLATDRVGHETLAVVDVEDVDLLVLADAGNIQQAPVDRARPFVMQFGMHHRGPIDLALKILSCMRPPAPAERN